MRFSCATPPSLKERRRGLFLAGWVLFGALALPLSCPHRGEAAEKPAEIPSSFSGLASWYGSGSHGKATASGRIFDRLSYTAAHRTLPFGTVLRVHNFRNGKHVLVLICDRGPFLRGRVVDVSMQAARELDFVSHGITPVWCEVVGAPNGVVLNKEHRFYVQLTVASGREEAERHVRDSALYLGMESALFRVSGQDGDSYITCAGPWPVFSEAETVLEMLPAYYSRSKVLLGPAEGDSMPAFTIPSSVSEPSPAAPKRARTPLKKKRTPAR